MEHAFITRVTARAETPWFSFMAGVAISITGAISFPDFAKRNRVIALDLPGHGQSDKPQIAYTMDLFANAIDAVMRDAKVERAVVAGHSMGTPVARQFYRKYPQKTLAIIIVDGGLRPFGTKEMREQFLAMFRAPNYKEASGPDVCGR